MLAKSVRVLCAQILFYQYATSQYIGSYYDGLGYGCRAVVPFAIDTIVNEWATYGHSSYGGGFPVTSLSPISPTGIYVTSENVYDGALAVTGILPFLSAVALEGSLPTAGAGGVRYRCDNGDIGMLSEDVGYGRIGGGYGAVIDYNSLVTPLGCGVVGPGYGYGDISGIGYRGYGIY